MRGIPSPMMGDGGAGVLVRSDTSVAEYRIPEAYTERCCFVLVVDMTETPASSQTLLGVYEGAARRQQGDPELLYDATYPRSAGISAWESGGVRSVRHVRGNRVVYKVNGRAEGSSRLYATDSATGVRSESEVRQNWTTGSKDGYIHVLVHAVVSRAAFFWAERDELPDVESLLSEPDASALVLPRTGTSSPACFVHYNTSLPGQSSFVAMLGGRRVYVPYVPESGTTMVAGVPCIDHWLNSRVKSASCFSTSAASPLVLPSAWAALTPPLWPATSAAFAGVAALATWATTTEYAAWVESTFDCSMFRTDWSAVKGAYGGLFDNASVANNIARWLTPDVENPSPVRVSADGWFVRWGYQRPQIVRRVALGADRAHSGCTFELRGCMHRGFGASELVASVTTVGSAEVRSWSPASLVRAFTHFELRHTGGSAEHCPFFVWLGE